MRKTIIKRVLNVFVISALFFACHDGLQVQEQQDKATVSFSLSDARTVFPHVSLADVASYRLWGGVDGDAETELAEFTTRGTVISLAPGMWHFTLNAYNESGAHTLQGTVENKQINPTGTNQVHFFLSVVNSGTGAIQITLNVPVSAGITQVVAKRDADSENCTPAGSGSFVYTKSAIAAGDHFISFELYRDTVLRMVVAELVLVRSGLTSGKTITLAGDDLKPVLTGTVSIMGSGKPGETLMADTYYLDGIGNISYRWKRTSAADGTTVEIGTDSNTYTVQDTDMDGYITVTATRDNYDGNITSAPITVKGLTRTIIIDMYDSYGDGWSGFAALRINVNGVDIATGVRVPTIGANRYTNTYTFDANVGDVVQLYWIAGTYQEENAFIVYYADIPPNPVFTTSNYSYWNGINALAYGLRNTMNSISSGTLLGFFTVW